MQCKRLAQGRKDSAADVEVDDLCSQTAAAYAFSRPSARAPPPWSDDHTFALQVDKVTGREVVTRSRASALNQRAASWRFLIVERGPHNASFHHECLQDHELFLCLLRLCQWACGYVC
jgi:hypothetical protein